MKLLLLDNSSLTPINGDYCIDPKTGAFVKELQGLGNEVTIYGQKVEAKDTTHTYRLLENGLKVVGLKRKKNKLLNYILLYLRIIPEIVKTDFVYVFYPTAYKYVAVLCWLFNKKYGLYIRGEKDLNNKVTEWICKKAFVIFTVSEYFTRIVCDTAGKNNVFTIRPMIPFTEKDVMKNRSYKGEGTLKALYLGRVTEDKGIKELIHAMSRLKKNKHNLELTIVGSGGFMSNAKALVEELEVDDIVHLMGAVDDSIQVADYFKKSDIYILPTYHEGFPRTLYEAMIFGTPVITTFVGGISGLMKDGYNCKEIRPKSVESIVGALEFAVNNYDKMIEYAKNGTETVLKVVDSKRMTHAEHLNEVIRIDNNGEKS